MTANVLAASDRPASAARQSSVPGARLALVLLLAINLFNYIDRYVLAAVEPDIRRELLANNPDAMAKTGLLSTAFFVAYMVMAPVFGWLGDRMSRWKLVGIGVILWTLASGASGISWHSELSQAFWILLLTRCFVGIGEAAYGPVAPTVISDLYPVERRGLVLAWFYAAIPVGSALGYTLGGQVASSRLFVDVGGWRWAFYLVVPPGILLGLWSFLMREPVRGQADRSDKATARQARFKDYLALLRIPSYVLDSLGMTAMTFALGGLAYWMPAYLDEQAVAPLRVRALGALIDARSVFGALTALAGLTGTLAGGMVGDALRMRFPGSYFLVSGAGMVVGFPMIVLVLFIPFPWAWIFVFVAVFCLFFNTGPSNTVLANVTPPAIRASAFAFNIFIIHALGDVISPPIIGFVAGHSSLKIGFLVLSVMTLVGGVLWFMGSRHLASDTALAPTRLASDE